MNDELLKGIRVLDFGAQIAGPAATMMLAFMGAEVIKVETRKRPDGARAAVVVPGRPPADPKYGENYFDANNASKKSLTVDFTKPEGRQIIRSLAAQSDIILENFTPGVMAKNGIGYEDIKEVKPDIIYISSSACGQTGPERNYMGYAAHFAHKAGLGHLTGYKDDLPSTFVGSIDFRSATMSAIAMLGALNYRERTGEGQYIDLASQEAIAAQLGDVYLDFILNNRVQLRAGNHRESYAPNNCYPCVGENKWVSISVVTDDEWQSLCKVIGKPELASEERFSNYQNRYLNQDELDEILGEWTKEKDYYEVTKLLQAAGVAAGPSLNAEGVFTDPHVVERGSFTFIDHPTMGKDCIITPPWHFSETPVKIKRHAPGLGEHNEEILGGILGLSTQEIESLKEKGVI